MIWAVRAVAGLALGAVAFLVVVFGSVKVAALILKATNCIC